MSGSEEHDDISLEDLVAFATRTASEETRMRVARAMKNQDHPLSCLIHTKAEMAEYVRAKRQGATATPEDLPSELADDGQEEPRSLDDIVRSSLRDDIRDYLNWEDARLNDELAEFLPEEEAVAYRAAGEDPITPYLTELRRVIRDQFNWPDRRDDPALSDPVDLVLALANAFVAHSTEVPFPPMLLAIRTVQLGLERFCRERG
jgi:hypothetical protein